MLNFIDRCYQYPRLVIGMALGLLLASVLLLFDFDSLTPRFEVDPSMGALLPASGAELETYQRARKLFGNDDVLLLAWIDPQLFTPANLGRFKQLIEAIESTPGVTATRSLATALDVQVGEDETRIDSYLREIPESQFKADRLRARALNDSLIRGQLVAQNGTGLLVAISFDETLGTDALIKKVEHIESINDAYVGDIEHVLSGPLLIRLEISRMLYRDLAHVIPLAVVLTVLVAIIGFRSLRGVVLPFVGNLTATTITVALFVNHGHQFNFVTVILPPVVYVIGFAYAIHVVTTFDRYFSDASDRRIAVTKAMSEVQLPLGLTALTTVVAFVALSLSTIESVHVFGLYTALGVGLAWLGAITVVPAGLFLIPASPAQRSLSTQSRRYVHWLEQLAIRRRRSVMLVAILAVVVSLGGTRSLETDTRVLNNFPSETGVERDFERLASIFSGPVPIWILITAEQPEAFKAPENLRTLAALERWLLALPEVGAAFSIVDYLDAIHLAIAPEHRAQHKAPTSERFVNHLLLTGGTNEVSYFVDAAFQTTLIRLRTSALSTAEVNLLSGHIAQRLKELPSHLDARVTGTSAMIAGTVDDITRAQIQSLFFAFSGVLVILCLLFRSAKMGIISLIPNILPVIFYFGVLGYSPIPLSLTTSLVACAVFGIAIDDSVHFLARFSIESRRHANAEVAVAKTLQAILKPVTLTTAALCAGFLALTQSELGSQSDFGLLAALTLFFAWLIDIGFTPALCGKFLGNESPKKT